MRRPTTIRSILTTVPFVLAFAASAPANDPTAPSFGHNAYAAVIADVDGVADADDYAASLLAGERLDVVVAAAKGSALAPALTLVAPDGSEFVPAGLVARNAGRSLTLHAFVVPTTGRWTVRVSGARGTQGAYTASFSIAAARVVTARRASIDDFAEVLSPFQGLDGALVDVTVVARDPKALVSIRGVTDPQGADVAGIAPKRVGRSVVLRRFALHGGDGTYRLRLGASARKALYDLKIKVTPQGRPTAKRPVVLSSFDPFLAPVAQPLQGAPGSIVRIDGAGFDPASPPRVLFGSAPAAATPAKDGRSMNVVVPDGVSGATVAVTVIGRDGQSAARASYFHYVELPAVTDLVDAQGRPVHVFAAAGGGELQLRGEFLSADQQVYFGTVQAEVKSVSGSTAMTVVVPAQAAGQVGICIVDAYGRTCRWSVVVEYMTAATITSVTALAGPGQIDSADVSVDGGATVEIAGANFHAGDVVTVGGAPADVVSATGDTLTIVVPPGQVGDAPIVVTNVLGQSASIYGVLSYQ